MKHKTKIFASWIFIILNFLECKTYGEEISPELMQLILHTPSVINERDVNDLKIWIKTVETGLKQHMEYSNPEFGWQDHLIVSAPYKHYDLNFDNIECGKFLSIEIMRKSLLTILHNRIQQYNKILIQSAALSFNTTLRITKSLQSEFEIISELLDSMNSKETVNQKKLVNFNWPLDYKKLLSQNLENKELKIDFDKINSIQYKGAKWETNQIEELPKDLFQTLPEFNSTKTAINTSLWVDSVQFCNSKHILKIDMEIEARIDSSPEKINLQLLGLPISTQSQKSFSLSEFIQQTEKQLARSQTYCDPTTSVPSDLFKCQLLQEFKINTFDRINTKEIENQSWVESANTYFSRERIKNQHDQKIINNLVRITSKACRDKFLNSLENNDEKQIIEDLLNDETIDFKRILCNLL